MKPQNLALSGVVLSLAGLAGLGISRIKLGATYDALDGSSTSAASLAESVSVSIGPAAGGALMALTGVLLLFSLWNWWKGRRHPFTLMPDE